MNNRRNLFLPFISVVFSLLMPAGVATAQNESKEAFARLMAVTGQVTVAGVLVSPAGARLQCPNLPLAEGTTVVCGRDGKALILLSNDKVVRVDAGRKEVINLPPRPRAETSPPVSSRAEGFILSDLDRHFRREGLKVAGANRGDGTLAILYPVPGESLPLWPGIPLVIQPIDVVTTLEVSSASDPATVWRREISAHASPVMSESLREFLLGLRAEGARFADFVLSSSDGASYKAKIKLLDQETELKLAARLEGLASSPDLFRAFDRAKALHAEKLPEFAVREMNAQLLGSK